MRTNGAFHRPGPVDRFRNWWYAKSRAQRVNKLLFLAAGLSAVAFVNAANRAPPPSAGFSVRTAPRPSVTAIWPSSTLSQAVATPTPDAPAPPSVPSTTSAPARPAVTTRIATTVKGPTSPPTTTGDPGVIFSDAPTTIRPPTPSSTSTPTTSRPTTTTAAPTTTAIPATTTTTAPRALLQMLLGG